MTAQPLVLEAPLPRPAPEQSVASCPNLTDSGNAERLVAKYGRELRYCAEWKAWLVWSGARWERDARGRVQHLAKEIARSIYGEAEKASDDTRAAIAGWAKKSESKASRLAMVVCAQSEPSIAVTAADFDRDPMLLNVANGTLNLKTGELRAHNPDDMLTKLAPVAFDKEARAPTFDGFVAQVVPDQEVRTFLQRVAGYCLTGDVSERTFFFLWGGGRNGKSVLMRIQRTIMGDYAIVAAPDLLMAKQKGDAHPCEIADLHGARLVCCQETPKDRRLNEQRIKELTGNEGEIKARRMNQNFWGFAPTFKLVIAGNHQPRVVDDTDSIWDRLRKVPFTVRISDEQVDKNLFEKLWAEAPGVLRWMVDGCLDWQRAGLPAPKAVSIATAGYRADEDVIGRFLADCCVLHPDDRATSKDLSAAAKQWCEANDETAFKPKAMAERLKSAACIPAKVNKARGWRGIRLLRDDEVRAREAEQGSLWGQGTRGDVTSPSVEMKSASREPNGEVLSPAVPVSLEASEAEERRDDVPL
jgi:putative DNA primase/helicase